MTKLIKYPDNNGFYGRFGGQIIPEQLKEEFDYLTKTFIELRDNNGFKELETLLTDFVGRPSPIYFAKNLSEKYKANIYLKREDLNHTGAHKINHSLGEAIFAKKLGKKKLIAETGAGQHGVATATAAALFNLECDIYMGEIDIEKAKPNVERMQILGANVIAVKSGTRTLKEAVDEAFCAYLKEYKTSLYAIGSVVGPYPFPMIIEYFQSIIGKEARNQMLNKINKLPDNIVACVGGGSNSIGLFSGFIDDKEVNIYGVEPLGKGTKIGENAASITYGKYGEIHGFKCLRLEDENGKIANAYSVASGLDYPGVGPKHCYLHENKRVSYVTVDDREAISAFYELSKLEGIIPALESSHALAYALKLAKQKQGEDILVNLSGRGDKDIEFVMKNYPFSKLY